MQARAASRPDGEHVPLGPGEVGVLAVSGPTVFAGYVAGHISGQHRIEPVGKTADGWLETGDLGHVDEEGFVYLRGRAKDLIIRGGHNIDPALIEDALLAHPQVTGAAAVGRPDRHAGEVPVAYVTLVAGATVDEAELLAWAGTHVAERAAAPKTVDVISQLPVTAVGKPSKLALRVDAARSELERALAHLGGVRAVRVEADQGALAAEIECATAADEQAVAAILSQYAITWRVVIRV